MSHTKGMSNSTKRAAIFFCQPGIGKTSFQEEDGRVSLVLRRAIDKAYSAFWKEYAAAKKELKLKPDFKKKKGKR